ncbi:MAG TPA: hypothetical protein VMH23_10915, partial [Bacteroidota bacterium]|nr:hypothetical protein [Bacteroidota bacterium]
VVTAKPQTLADTILVTNKGTGALPLWEISRNLPPWLSVRVWKLSSSVQGLITKISTSGLKAGRYHAIVRAHNREPVSQMPMSTLWYDVEMNLSTGE